MSKNEVYKELKIVTIEDLNYLCKIEEPTEEQPSHARTKITSATAFAEGAAFPNVVDKWLCQFNTDELTRMTVGKNQGYTVTELQEDQLVILQQRSEFMEVTKKLALSRVYNSQYMKFIKEL